MLDLARKWHPVPFIYRYIDLCYLLTAVRNPFVSAHVDIGGIGKEIAQFFVAIQEEAKCVKPRLAALAEKTWNMAIKARILNMVVSVPPLLRQFL